MEGRPHVQGMVEGRPGYRAWWRVQGYSAWWRVQDMVEGTGHGGGYRGTGHGGGYRGTGHGGGWRGWQPLALTQDDDSQALIRVLT